MPSNQKKNSTNNVVISSVVYIKCLFTAAKAYNFILKGSYSTLAFFIIYKFSKGRWTCEKKSKNLYTWLYTTYVSSSSSTDWGGVTKKFNEEEENRFFFFFLAQWWGRPNKSPEHNTYNESIINLIIPYPYWLTHSSQCAWIF